MVTETALRQLLQLPARPYSETVLYDGSRYYDLTEREALAVLSVTGAISGNANYSFISATDYNVIYNSIDFGSSAHAPVLGTPVVVTYTASPLGSDAATQACFFANTIVPQNLGSTYPSGTSPSGVDYANLQLMGELMVAAREACLALASSETHDAIKYRRGAVQMDGTLVPKNWIALSNEWNAKYDKYLNMIRPGGKPSAFLAIAASAWSLVFPSDAYLTGFGSDIVACTLDEAYL